METKQCRKCKEVKPVSEFYKDKHKKDRLTTNCKECKNKQHNKYIYENKDKVYKMQKKYYQENKERINECQRKRRTKNPLFKLSCNIGNLIRISIKGNGYTKNSKTHDILGISFKGFKEHIEKQFTEGMSWDNRSEWHLDHIIPISSHSNEEEIHLLNHHLNFQPLWAEDNMSKSDKYTEEDKQAMLTKIRLWKK